MAIPRDQIENLARLAYLDPEEAEHLFHGCADVLRHIEQLHAIDTQDISPLHHPLAATQPLRVDDKIVPTSVHDLASAATLFEAGFYIVPQIIKGL